MKTWTWMAVLALMVSFLTLAMAQGQGDNQDQVSQSKLSTITINDDKRPIKSIKVLVRKVGGRVDWCHKNDLIAFNKFESEGGWDRLGAHICTMKSDGSEQVCLTKGKKDVPQVNNDQPTWHPSCEYIVFQSVDPELKEPERITHGGTGIHNNLWAMTKDGSKFYQLTHVKMAEGSLHPHFSHDGKKLFWAAREAPKGWGSGRWVLKVADFVADDKGVRLENVKTYDPLKKGREAFYESHCFTTDDKKIIFSASPTAGKTLIYDDLDIYAMDLETEKVTRLTDSTGGVWNEHAQISPSGKKIIWMSSQGYKLEHHPLKIWTGLKTDFWMMNADGSNKTRLTYFNEKGYPEYQGGVHIVVADNSWNKEGDKLVAVMFVFAKSGREVQRASHTILIEFKEPQ